MILKSQFIGVGRKLFVFKLLSMVHSVGLYTAKMLIRSHEPRMLVHDDNAYDLSKNISP